jgi:hypothetical protein
MIAMFFWFLVVIGWAQTPTALDASIDQAIESSRRAYEVTGNTEMLEQIRMLEALRSTSTAPPVESSAPAEPTRAIVIIRDARDIPTSQSIRLGVWLLRLTAEKYGKNNVFFAPYLCRFNAERGMMEPDCSTIRPNQRVLLPRESILWCMVEHDAGWECDPSALMSEAEQVAVAALPMEREACVWTLREANPYISAPHLMAIARSLAHEYDANSQAYRDACSRTWSYYAFPVREMANFAEVDLDGDFRIYNVGVP